MITIVNMGIGSADTLTLAAVKLAKNAQTVILQTEKVDTAEYLKGEGVNFQTLDALYEAAEDFSSLTASVCEFFEDRQDAAFFILGSASNSALAAALKEKFECRELPGVSFFESALAACGISSPYAKSIAADDIDGAELTAEYPIAVTEVDSEYRASDVVLKFERYYPYDSPVFLVKGCRAQRLPLCEIARSTDFSYDTAIVFPGLPLTGREGYTFEDLVRVIAMLRAENGCPWDREQTHESLRQHLIEESLEAIDAINGQDADKLYDELGDVLLQVVMHAQIAREHSDFDDIDVTTSECKKMIHRHTHVFGGDKIEDAEGVLKNWDKIKRKDAGETVSGSMRAVLDISPLLKAAKVQKKASLCGFDWENYEGAFAKLREETDELEQSIKQGGNAEEEAGDLLFSAVNVLRLLKISPDMALFAAIEKFIKRYEFMEQAAKADGRELTAMSLEEQDVYWDRAKAEERK